MGLFIRARGFWRAPVSISVQEIICVEVWVIKETCWTRLVTIPYLRPFLRPIFLSNNNVEVLMLDASYDSTSLIAYNLNENTPGTIFKPHRAKEIEEQLMMCNLNDEHDNLRSIFCNPTPVIAVATYVESLYSLDCSDVQPDVGL